MDCVRLGFKAKQFTNKPFFDYEKINTIRTWLDDAQLPLFTAEQIILFLTSCDQDIQLTQKTIRLYYKTKKGSPRLFTNRTLDDIDIQSGLNTCEICIWQDKEDYQSFIYYKFKNDFWNWSLATCAKLVFMVTECAIFDYPPKEITFIVNSEKLTFPFLSKFCRPSLLQTIFVYIQEAFPSKLKEIHIINALPIANKFFKLIKPFMGTKLLNQFFMHSSHLNWNEFYQTHLPKRLLPEDLGGELASIETLQKRTLEKMKQMQSYYDAEELSIRQSN